MVTSECPPLVIYDKAFLSEAGAEFSKLGTQCPNNGETVAGCSNIKTMLIDYKWMRDRCRVLNKGE